MKNEIKLVQLPIISHKIKEVGKSVSKRIEKLEIEKQIATVETVKSLKDLRAELNKELANFETQRKTIKEGVNNPYLEFEALYKVEILERYNSSLSLLKDKIAFVENKIKSEKKESVEAYFNELCVAEKIDFITFEKLGIEINLSTSEKKYKEQVHDYIQKVNDDLALIKTTDFEAEILTEYKLSLNVSNAITGVKTRKENEENEKSRIKAERTQKRKKELESIGMNYVEITNSYEFNADIYIAVSEIYDLKDEDFISKKADFEVKINDLKAKELDLFKDNISTKENESIIVEKSQPSTISSNPTITKPVIVSAPVFSPKTETPSEHLKTASFTVTATMTQLRALGDYMKQNNITYKNI